MTYSQKKEKYIKTHCIFYGVYHTCFQQLDTVAVADTNAKRLFHGVQGDKRNQGELFGIENMFKLREGDTCLTSDILQVNSHKGKL